MCYCMEGGETDGLLLEAVNGLDLCGHVVVDGLEARPRLFEVRHDLLVLDELLVLGKVDLHG